MEASEQPTTQQNETKAGTIDPEEAASRMLPSITPQELTAAVETPGAFKEIAKADLYMEMARMRRLMKSNAISMGDRLKYVQQLARMSGVDSAPVDADGNITTANIPQISIVINAPSGPQQVVGQTLDHKE